MPSWLTPRVHLTPEQIKAVELDPGKHRVIFGAPGSGKTMILLYRARYLIDNFGVKPERFRIVVFTNVLKQYIRSALEFLQLPEGSVSTFDSLCSEYYRTKINQKLPWDEENKQPDFSAITENVLKLATKEKQYNRPFDFILVDEGQDLDLQAYNTLTALSQHVSVFMDHKQQVYDRGSSQKKILESLGKKRISFSLLNAFRCSSNIVMLASRFISDDDERTSFISQSNQSTSDEKPEVYVADGFEDEKARLIEVVRERQMKGDRIAILLPQKRQVFGFAKGLREAGLEVEIPEQIKGRSDFAPLDFTTNIPKLMPYPSAKGITFDSVLMPRLSSASFGKMPIDKLQRLIFVGITRATKWVYMSGDGGRLPIFKILAELEEEKQIVINRCNTSPGLFDL